MNGQERRIRSKREIEIEINQWKRKLIHAKCRLKELNARWDFIPESKRGLLGEFIERLETDIGWFEDEMALCECELRGREF